MARRWRTFLLVSVLLIVALAVTGCAAPSERDVIYQPEGIWEAFVVSPLAQALIILNRSISGIGIPFSYGWAIIVFTIVIKLLTLPLTMKQLQSAKATQELQPRLKEIQEKYAKDRQKLSEEQMKLYKEAGVNPLGGCLPLLVQMPILFGLYQALYALASLKEGGLQGAGFFWVPNLAFPEQVTGMGWLSESFGKGDWGMLFAYSSLPIIMIVSQLVLQKMTQPETVPVKSDKPDQSQMMSQMMMFMPIMFGYITLGLPSGLTLYWSVSNILSIVQQYFITGWGSLGSWIPALKPRSELATETTSDPFPDSALDKPKRRRRRK